MKLYDGGPFPNPRRVRIFLAEKGLPLPEIVPIDLRLAQNREEAFAAVNPWRTIPVLELDDGTRIAESVAICRYFEELHPEPPLFGHDATEKALVEMWSRRIEFGLYDAVRAAFRHGHPGMAAFETPQVPDWAAASRGRAVEQLRLLDDQLSRHRFVAGERYTIADITTQVTIDFMRFPKLQVPEDCAHVRRWHAEVTARPSAGA
jgi:glutathione S-transferase